MKDPILAEVRAAREAYAIRFAGDVKGMLDDIRIRQAKGGRQVIARPPKRLALVQEPASARGPQTSK